MKCDVGIIIDRDVPEKRYENKFGDVMLLNLNHCPLITSSSAPPNNHT